MSAILKKIITVVSGSAVAAYGMDLAIHAGFGGATLSVLWKGISLKTGMSLGTASFLVAAVMVIVSFIGDRKQIGWGTLLYQVVYSACIDAFVPLLRYTGSAVPDILLMLLGIVLFAFGSALYSYADFGRGSYEALTFTVVALSGWKIRTVRILLDVGCVLIGMLLGGTFGLCTVATVLLSGPVLQKSLLALKGAGRNSPS